MKYFIDFEASQWTQEIIQIGCVREDGQTFKSLVKPRKIKHITQIITELTGLEREMFDQARTSDEVFSDFFDWLFTDRTPVEFFCYGNADLVFVKNNLKRCTHIVKSQAALSLIAADLTDVTAIVEEHFQLKSAPSLKKVTEYYFPNDDHVCHDALSDAEMLRQVYNALTKEKYVRGIPFPDHVGVPTFKKIDDFARFNIVRCDKSQNSVVYKTFDEAKDFLIGCAKKQRVDLPTEVARRKLIAAINSQSPYYGFAWVAEVKRDQQTE